METSPRNDTNPEEITFNWELLPEGPQWQILNNDPITSVIDFCRVNKKSASICLLPHYFQQRLQYYKLPVTRYQEYISLGYQPVDAYVRTIVDLNKIESLLPPASQFGSPDSRSSLRCGRYAVVPDESILVYLDRSKMLFKGIEMYIGLAKTGIRAIQQEDWDMLFYILRLHPNNYELRDIIGTLRMKYFWYYTRNIPFPLLTMKILPVPTTYNVKPELLLNNLLDTHTGESIHYGKYYPQSIEEYMEYNHGLDGIERKEFDLCDSHLIMAYFFGLIDGKHSELFLDKFNSVHTKNRDESHNWDQIIRHLVPYASSYGTVEMIIRLLQSTIFFDPYRSMYDSSLGRGELIYLESAVAGNNLSVVDYLLLRFLNAYGSKLTENVAEIKRRIRPTSIEMVDLFESYDIHLSYDITLVGMIESGNYEGILRYWTIDPTSLHSIDVKHLFMTKPYLIYPYILKKYVVSIGVTTIDLLISNLTIRLDLYRVNLLFKLLNLGNKFNPSNYLKVVDLNKLSQLVGIDWDHYPQLKKYIVK